MLQGPTGGRLSHTDACVGSQSVRCDRGAGQQGGRQNVWHNYCKNGPNENLLFSLRLPSVAVSSRLVKKTSCGSSVTLHLVKSSAEV